MPPSSDGRLVGVTGKRVVTLGLNSEFRPKFKFTFRSVSRLCTVQKPQAIKFGTVGKSGRADKNLMTLTTYSGSQKEILLKLIYLLSVICLIPTKLAYIHLEYQDDIMNIPEQVSLLCNWQQPAGT